MMSLLPITALAATSFQGDGIALRAEARNRGEWAYPHDLPAAGCQGTGSSGFIAADEASCSAVTRRARFRPARNAAGIPIESEHPACVTFSI
ncbi:MAG: hypothetical protein K0R64_1240 [Novosphingobium lindaniclasticum]|jgi:hypothetical protein|nr:hypothetical protein [Novosphingobium lindaniclasticum]